MPTVHFTPHLERFVSAPALDVEGATVADVLAAVLAANPPLRGYLVDDRGKLRKHVAVFVDGTLIRDRESLRDPVGASSEVFVMQALSGG